MQVLQAEARWAGANVSGRSIVTKHTIRAIVGFKCTFVDIQTFETIPPIAGFTDADALLTDALGWAFRAVITVSLGVLAFVDEDGVVNDNRFRARRAATGIVTIHVVAPESHIPRQSDPKIGDKENGGQ